MNKKGEIDWISAIITLVILLIYFLVGLVFFQLEGFQGREEKVVNCYDKLGSEIEGLECKQQAIEVSQSVQIFVVAIYILGGILILILNWLLWDR